MIQKILDFFLEWFFLLIQWSEKLESNQEPVMSRRKISSSNFGSRPSLQTPIYWPLNPRYVTSSRLFTEAAITTSKSSAGKHMRENISPIYLYITLFLPFVITDGRSYTITLPLSTFDRGSIGTQDCWETSVLKLKGNAKTDVLHIKCYNSFQFFYSCSETFKQLN